MIEPNDNASAKAVTVARYIKTYEPRKNRPFQDGLSLAPGTGSAHINLCAEQTRA